MPFLLTLLAVVAAVILILLFARRVTVLEYERGLRYVRGRFRGLIEPGQYWYMPCFAVIHKLDVRQRFVSITGQEILSADGVTLKVSLAACYEIADPAVAVNGVQSFQDALYLELQLALREIIGSAEIDDILSTRGQMSRRLMELAEPKARALGLRLVTVDLKDIMFPGKLKEVFAQVVNARKEALASLEKARGETAALRNLANAARMIESNPNLLQLRLVQAVGQTSGNTLVLGVPSQSVPVPLARDKSDGNAKGQLPGNDSAES